MANQISVPPFSPDRFNIAPVRPLVYSDGLTILEYLKMLQKWINESLLTHLNDELAKFGKEIDKLIDEVNDALAAQTAEFERILQEVINNSIELQDAVMAGILGDGNSDTRQALNQIVDARITGIVTDGFLAGMINAPSSATGQAVDAKINTRVPAILDETFDIASVLPASFDLEYYLEANYSGAPSVPQYHHRGYLMNPRMNTALTKVHTGEADMKILVISDSTGSGVGSDGPYDNLYSWPSEMARQLFRHTAPCIYGLSIPPSDNRPTGDNRWTLGSGWTQTTVGGLGLGGRRTAYQGAPGSGPMTFFDPRIEANEYDVYFSTNSSPSAAGIITAGVAGGTPVSVDTAQAKGLKMLTVTGPLGNTGVSITNTDTQGNIFVIGVEPRRSGSTKQIRVSNASVSASSTASWLTKESTGGTPTDAWNVLSFLPLYKPDLTIIDLGINDAGNDVSVSDYMTRLQTLADAAYDSGSAVLIKTMIPSSGSRAAREAEYAAAVKGMSRPYAVIDLFNHYGSHARNAARGWMVDWGHGNRDMYTDEGKRMADFIDRYARRYGV